MDITTENKLVNFFFNNIPDLYLGAGFSFGAKQEDGTEIPLGNDIKTALINKFFPLDNDLQHELKKRKFSEVCELVKQSDVDGYINFITEMFSGFKPEPYHFFLTDYRWKAIYTVNIDDIVEQIFRINKLQLKIYDKKRNSTIFDSSEKDTLLYKLHGSITNNEEGYVFSKSEYDDFSNDTTDYRFMKFIVSLHEKPLIVIGTEFDEIELDSLLNLYRRANKSIFLHEIIFINPKPSAYLKASMKNFPKWTLLEITAEDFLTFIHTNKNKLHTNYFSEIQLIRRNQCLSLEIIKHDLQEELSYKSKLYFGYSPTWEDVAYDYLINYSFLDNMLNQILELKFKCYVLFGRIYSGRSSALKYFFLKLAQEKDTLCLYYKNDELSIASIKQIVAGVQANRVFLFIDDAADYYSLFEKIIDIDSHLYIISTSNITLHQRKRYALDHHNTTEININVLVKNDIVTIKEKLENKGFAGELNNKSLNEWEKRIGISQNITSALYTITRSETFKDYYRRYFSKVNIKDKKYYQFLLICAILYKINVSYLSSTLLYKINININTVFDNECEEFIQIYEKERYRIVSPYIADSIIEDAERQFVIENIIKITQSISGVVTEIGKSYWKTAYEYLTKYKSLRTLLGLTNQEIDILYSTIMPAYRDRSYFWLQKGILEQNGGNFELANNHFDAALAIHKNSYTILHAKARNYCKRSLAINELSKANFYFDEGKKIFENLIEKQEYLQNKAYSVHSLVNERILFCKVYNLEMDSKEIRQIRHLLDEVIRIDPDDASLSDLYEKFNLFFRNQKQLFTVNYESYEEYIDD
jgi:hypothetical protein